MKKLAGVLMLVMAFSIIISIVAIRSGFYKALLIVSAAVVIATILVLLIWIGIKMLFD